MPLMKFATDMSRLSEKTKQQCNTIEDLWNLETNNGIFSFSGISTIKLTEKRYRYFKEYLKEVVSELTEEEIIKFDSVFQRFKQIYSFVNASFFLACLELENK